jgi:hypothetical protein
MKKSLTVFGVLFLFGTVLSSCGSSSSGNETSDNDKKQAKEYDCECGKVIEKWQSGMKKAWIANKDNSPNGQNDFTGTCAEFSDDRDKRLIGLYKYMNGYRVKKEQWYYNGDEKIKTSEVTYDEKDRPTGFEKTIKTNNNVGVYFTTDFVNYQNGKKVNRWVLREGYYERRLQMDFYAYVSKYKDEKEVGEGCQDMVQKLFDSKDKNRLNNFLNCLKSENLEGFVTGKIAD